MKSEKINMKNKNIWMGVVVLGLIILAGIGYQVYTGYYAHTQAPAEAQVIKIGYVGPLTGVMAAYGEQERQGIDLAIEEINAKGGIDGKRLEIIYEDDQMDATRAANALNKLITVDKVPAVIGELTITNTLAIAPIAERNKVVLISPLASSSKLSDSGEYIFKIYFTTAQEAKKLVELTSSLNLTNGAILYINNDLGTDLAQLVEEEFVQNGGTLSISEGYAPDATDFRTQLAKVQAKNASVIFILGWPRDMSLIVKQSKELGIKSQFIASEAFNEPLITEWSGNASEGVLFVVPSNGDPDKWIEFSQKIQSKYGNNATFLTTMTYDATKVLAAAMQNKGTSSEDIKTGLYQLKDYPGVSGNITFDKNGDVVTRLLAFMIVHNGKFEAYK